MSIPAAVRRRRQVDDLCGAAVRAVSGDPLLHFRGGRLHRGTAPYPVGAPHLRPAADDDDFRSFRGTADGLALRRCHSDPELHERLRPAGDVPGMIFDMLEQFRVEALAPRAMPGLLANLRHRHVTWSRACHRSGLTETAGGILLFTLAQICRSRITGEPVVVETEGLVEATRFGLVPEIGNHLAELRRHRGNQPAFAIPARAIAELVASMLADASAAEAVSDRSATRRARCSLFFYDAADDRVAPMATTEGRLLSAADDSYRVFTRAYDRQHDASALVRPALLRQLRERLDEQVSSQRANVPRLALELRAVLADPAQKGWDADREHGRIDGRRLAGLITSPNERRLFREERVSPVADTVVTFLLDCSGSMRRHRQELAMVLDVLLRAMDLAAVSTELLGFTTGGWNGGRPLKEWIRSGRPDHPGRLNELCHLVFKDADSSWRRARPAIAALLKGDLYREGIDGEAVAWACARMGQRPEQRRILVIVSDGSPMDSATNLANGAHYLDHHLRGVVAAVQAGGAVRVCGLGVGLDLSAFYPESIVLDLGASTSNQVFREVVWLLAGRARS